MLEDEGSEGPETDVLRTNQPGRQILFFPEWASYLRKPEVLEQNSVQEQSLDLGNGDGMPSERQRRRFCCRHA